MKIKMVALIVALLAFGTFVFGSDADLTIYNQNFAVVRVMVPLDLKRGITEIHLTDMTSNLEPDSVHYTW